MEQKERLVQLIIDSVNGCARNWAEVIANHLIENGIIVPPCKVGDSVYWFNMIGEIEEAQVIEPSFVARLKDGFEYDVRYSDVGKTVFLTRELAEEKLDE